MNQSHIKKDSIMAGVINATINGLIYLFTNAQGGNVLLTSDMISSTEHTVMAGAVPLAVSLAFILTSISYFIWKLPGKPAYFPVFFRMALKHSIFAFGLVVIFAVLLQRFAGSVHVSTLIASVITGFIANSEPRDFHSRRKLLLLTFLKSIAASCFSPFLVRYGLKHDKAASI